jgi:hypothetical protein
MSSRPSSVRHASARFAAAALVPLVLLATPATAQEPVPGPDEQLVTFDCPDGSEATGVLPPDPTQAEMEAAMRAACPEGSFDEPEQPAAPRRKGPKVAVQDKSLLQQDLSDLRANRFFLKVRCSRACSIKSSVQGIVLSPRALPVGESAKRKLAAGRWTKVPVRFKAPDVRIFRRAAKVRVTGFITAKDRKGGMTTYTWERTCRLG